MKGRHFLLFIAVICCVCTGYKTGAQSLFENVIQIDGVTMTADSLRAVPGVVVQVKNKNRGVQSEYNGVFSIVCYKGDTLQFISLGCRSKEFTVPIDIKGRYFSMIQLMVQDTFYLPETIIRPLPSKGEFDYAFQHWQVPDDQYELARRNTDAYTLRALRYTVPKDGREAQGIAQNQIAQNAIYYGIQRPQQIFSPLAWAEFFEAWKRGDYRKSSNPYNTANY